MNLNDGNIFNEKSSFFKLRWFIVCCMVVAVFMYYSDTVGWRFLSFNNQESWRASGSGYHK